MCASIRKSVRPKPRVGVADRVALMFESFELPPPEAVADLDDLGLLDTMALATMVETAAFEVRTAVISEIYTRQLRATSRPKPARPHAALPSRRRHRRKARKRRRRR
jgi:hypothetical protein